jgi:hypothetical protein
VSLEPAPHVNEDPAGRWAGLLAFGMFKFELKPDGRDANTFRLRGGLDLGRQGNCSSRSGPFFGRVRSSDSRCPA